MQLDLSAISALVDTTLHMLDAAMEHTANWILQLLDVREELATSIGVNISVPDINEFAEKVGKPFVSKLQANISSRFGSQDIISAFSILDPKKVPSIDSADIKTYGESFVDTLCAHFGVPCTPVCFPEKGAAPSNPMPTIEANVMPFCFKHSTNAA